MTKLLKSRFNTLILGILLLIFPRVLPAQGAMNALTYVPYTGGKSSDIIVYNYTGSVGWSFVPTSNLLVTAISSIAPQVSFWLGTNQVIASYNFAGSPTNFQTIPFLFLSAGQTYSISTQFTNTTFAVYPLGSGTDGTSFSISPYISRFESYFGLPGSQSGTTTNALFGGPNFQFQFVPPLNIKLIGNAVILSWTDPTSAFFLQSATNVTGVYTNVVDAASPYTNSITGSQMFFRLQAN
jgi:hypothetical protein